MKRLAWLLIAVPGLAHGATVCKLKGDQGGSLKIEWKASLPGGSTRSWNRYSYQLVQVSGELAGYTYDEPAVAQHRSISTRCGGEDHTSFYLHDGYELSFKDGGGMCGFHQESASLISPDHQAIPLECRPQDREGQ